MYDFVLLLELPSLISHILVISSHLATESHRLKQTKDVKITYLDSVGTVDIVMRQINMMKQENSRIVLADGSSIGMRVDMNYRDLSGIIGKALLGIIQMRTLLKEKNAESGDPDAPLLPHEVEDLDSKLKEIIEARDESKKKKTAVMKEEDNSSGSDNDDDDEDDDGDDVKMAASFKSNNPSLNSDNESSDDDSGDDDNLLYGKSMFSSTSRKSNVKEERVETKRKVLDSKSKDEKEEIIELSSDEEDSDDDDDDKAGSVPTKKESQSHTQFKHQDGSMKDQTFNDRHIQELTEEEQLQALASMEELEVNEDKENSCGPSRRDSGDGEEFFDAAETLDEIKKNDDNVMRKEEESKPPAVEKSSVEAPCSSGNVARIQIKLPNGKRIVKSFDENQQVKDVYTFMANSEEIKGKAFEFKVGFPPKNLGGRDESIKSASLDGESISVVWK